MASKQEISHVGISVTPACSAMSAMDSDGVRSPLLSVVQEMVPPVPMMAMTGADAVYSGSF